MSNDYNNQEKATVDNPQSNGLRAYLTLKAWLDSEGWVPQPIPEKTAFWTRYSAASGILTCYFQIFLELEQFVFYGVPQIKVPSEKRTQAAEYITRVNYGMRIGSFNMDWNTGDISFRSSINFMNETLSPGLIWNAVEPSIQAIDIYIPGLAKVIEELQSPIRAINAIDYGV